MASKKAKSAAERKKRSKLLYLGTDNKLDALTEIDPLSSMSYTDKLTLIYQLSLFEYQMRNQTNDVPRLLRTTACIRKP
jgi:hypothetical protein